MNTNLAPSIRDQRRDRILQAARQVFFEEGFSAATMSMIAARLGGSKGTLYAYFKSKDELFDALILDQCSAIQSALGNAGQAADVRATLVAFGHELVTAMTSDFVVRTLQLVIEESVRNPELARRIDEAGQKQGQQAMANYLAQAHGRGEICAPDPMEAARVLGCLLKGDGLFRRLMGLEAEPTPAAISSQVETAVNVFLRAYAPK